MIEILRSGLADFERAASGLAPRVQQTLAKIALCQTAALGGRHYRCASCEQSCVLYNSCGDRHCPQCRGARRAEWTERTQTLLLEGIDYYQVVFTLPHELSALALGNRRLIYDLLFGAAWKALSHSMRDEHGIDPAALLVLHTWNQRLEHHPHVHAVVPGSGPSVGEDRWVRCRRPGSTCDESGVQYLVDADRLRAAWREAFLRGLDRLYAKGELKLGGSLAPLRQPERWQAWVRHLRSMTWVCFIQPPPAKATGPEEVVRYLARYLTGGPISDRRIVAADSKEVTFWARQGTTPGGDRRQVPLSMGLPEFLRRWSLHVLPKDFTKVRRFGGWSNRRCASYLERCAIMMDSAGVPLGESALQFDPADWMDSTEAAHDDSSPQGPACPQCRQPMTPDYWSERPAWREVFAALAAAPDRSAANATSLPPKNWQSPGRSNRIRKEDPGGKTAAPPEANSAPNLCVRRPSSTHDLSAPSPTPEPPDFF